ncbi:hypothetical protein Agub_g8651 [Astrephomene gubernaculifera]|uniref:Uncharacterized protein n=1 Tax=Astrephomene gubernaculifera TaxID=47775 RepID=A0AAD3DTW6_9CHLO|nr:hypothetical protein Agub_g8651 [Astrephomene gubernaculifera]
MRVILLAAVIAIAAGMASATDADQNSWDFMVRKTASCANVYNATIESPYYKNNAVCKTQVMLALDTYNVSKCPSTATGSTVWKCMSGWNGTAINQKLVNAWTSFLTSCEVLYIAQRVNTAESEDGFQWLDNSCFPRFTNLAAFNTYLTTAPGNSSTTPSPASNSAGMNGVSLLKIIFGVVAAFLFLYH